MLFLNSFVFVVAAACNFCNCIHTVMSFCTHCQYLSDMKFAIQKE